MGALFTEWYGPLVRYACRATGSLEAAEDLVQAAFLDLFRALVEGKTVENAKGWTLCVVRRRVVDRLRERKRHGGAFLELSEAEGLPQLRVEAAAEWEKDDLGRLIAELSAREEEVLLLRAQSLSYREIAGELKIGINSVKTLLSRAIHKMQRAAEGKSRKVSEVDGDTFRAALQ